MGSQQCVCKGVGERGVLELLIRAPAEFQQKRAGVEVERAVAPPGLERRGFVPWRCELKDAGGAIYLLILP